MENPRQLLTEAFKAHRRDRYIETRPEYRMAGIEEINGSSFRYNGQLPQGIREFARPPASVFGQGDPYLVFDEPLDMGLVEQSISEVFGKRRIERETNNRISVRGRVLWIFDGEKYLFRFWKEKLGQGASFMEYYTDSSADEFRKETPKVIEAVARYLERCGEKKEREAKEKQVLEEATSGKSPPVESA